MAVSVPAAVIISGIIAAGGAIASAELQPKPPKPTPPPDPSIAREDQLRQAALADNSRARAIAEQKVTDQQFVQQIRQDGLKL